VRRSKFVDKKWMLHVGSLESIRNIRIPKMFGRRPDFSLRVSKARNVKVLIEKIY
jgi:hypothetical protein